MLDKAKLLSYLDELYSLEFITTGQLRIISQIKGEIESGTFDMEWSKTDE